MYNSHTLNDYIALRLAFPFGFFRNIKSLLVAENRS